MELRPELAPSGFLRALFDAAVEAVTPARCVPPHLPDPPRGRALVVGAGKAAAAMARAVEQHWEGPFAGLVVTPYGHAVPCETIEVVEAAHPVPDAAGREAAARVLELVQGLSPEDLVLCLLSGGGSALLACPPPWISFEEKQRITRELLASGAPIDEINCVRKHLSRIKGGQLGAACYPARVVTLMISDVPGDDPSVIASGPTVGDPTTAAEALAVLAKRGIAISADVAAGLRRHETPAPDDPRLWRCEHVVVARARVALEAAAAVARRGGAHALVLGDRIEGESRAVAAADAARARTLARDAAPDARPCVLLSGGETTVVVRGRGRGGRNSEYALALALHLESTAGIWALAADTDGIDGTERNAGALVAPDTLPRAAAAGLDAAALLADNDAHAFFAALGDLVVTGPTRTNVNDFRAILVL